MKTRKIIALGLAAVMTAGMLTGCGGSESKENASNDKGEEVVTLKWVTIGNGMPSNYDSWIGKVNDYIGEKIGVNLEMEVIPWVTGITAEILQSVPMSLMISSLALEIIT